MFPPSPFRFLVSRSSLPLPRSFLPFLPPPFSVPVLFRSALACFDYAPAVVVLAVVVVTGVAPDDSVSIVVVVVVG